MSYRIINGRAVGSCNPIGSEGVNLNKSQSKTKGEKFSQVLNNALERERGYKVSKHAEDRLKSVNFSEADMKNIGKGFEMAKEKGSKNSVLLYKNVALVTSIENKTIITAVDESRAEENVFTNIDSVVIL